MNVFSTFALSNCPMRVGGEERGAKKELTFFFALAPAPFFFSTSTPRQKKIIKTERLDELRALNRKTFEETGEYMTEEEIRAFRQPRWTDRREFQDDD